MIDYSSKTSAFGLILRWRGSIFPKALLWAIPASINAGVVNWLWYDIGGLEGIAEVSAAAAVWSSFTFILGFLVVFRAQQAYARYWEGATLVQQARANFFNCCSNLIAFCTSKPEMREPVEEFQHLLVRLVSMLQCVGLQTVADMESVRFEFFNTDGIDKESLRFLSSKMDKHQRCEIVAQWIQRLIINADRSGIIDVAPPILTRCFQELSQGLVHIINARIMTGIPFPFPYAQMLSLLMVIHWLVTPAFFALVINSHVWSSLLTFLCVLAFWGTNYIAAEIESPFGDAPNDLPLFALQKDMNSSLWVLLHSTTQRVPSFSFNKLRHRKWDVVCANNFDHAQGLRRGGTALWMKRKSQTKITIQSSLHGASDTPGDDYFHDHWHCLSATMGDFQKSFTPSAPIEPPSVAPMAHCFEAGDVVLKEACEASQENPSWLIMTDASRVKEEFHDVGYAPGVQAPLEKESMSATMFQVGEQTRSTYPMTPKTILKSRGLAHTGALAPKSVSMATTPQGSDVV